jgi:photosystem II stability/assembly factor-like uncharacterized protein
MTTNQEQPSSLDAQVASRLRGAAQEAADQHWSFSADDVFAAVSPPMHARHRYRLPRSSVGRVATTVVVAVLIVVVFLVPLPQLHLFGLSPANQPSSLNWSATDLGPAEFTAVACSTPTHCIALGPNGWTASSDDGGTLWTSAQAVSLPDANFTKAVCPSATRCVAVSGPIETVFTSLPGIAVVSSDGGLHWARANIPGSPAEMTGGLTCPTSSVCYAPATGLGRNGQSFLLKSTNGGLSWTARLAGPKNGFRGAISCPTARRCWAVGGSSEIVTTSDGGRTWEAQKVPMGGGGQPGLEDLYCPNVLHCVAVGIEPSPGYPIGVVTDNGGSSWRFADFQYSSTSMAQGREIGGAVASATCSAAGRCVAVGTAAISGPILEVSDDWGNSWRQPASPSSESGGRLMAVTCDAQERCIVVGSTENGAALIATNLPQASWTVRYQGVGSNWASISCPGLNHCVAVGSGPLGYLYPDGAGILTSDDGGVHWVRRELPAGIVAVIGVDCPAAGRCFATAEVVASSALLRKGTPWVATILRSDDGGSTWHLESLPGALLLAGISCPSLTSCFAAGAVDANGVAGHDAIVATVDGGAHWAAQAVPTPPGAQGLSTISCPSPRQCWAVGDLVALVTANGGRTWRDQPLAGVLQAIDCPTKQMCVVTSVGSGTTSTSYSPVHLTRNGGRTWLSPPSPVEKAVLTGVSCPTSSECVAVGSDSHGAVVLASFDGGRRWSVQTVAHSVQAVSYDTVRCAKPRHCVILGGGWISELVIGE